MYFRKWITCSCSQFKVVFVTPSLDRDVALMTSCIPDFFPSAACLVPLRQKSGVNPSLIQGHNWCVTLNVSLRLNTHTKASRLAEKTKKFPPTNLVTSLFVKLVLWSLCWYSQYLL